MAEGRRFLRERVRLFAREMVAKLIANEHKPGWREDNPSQLLRRLDDEVAELRRVVLHAVRVEEIRDPYGPWSRRAHDGGTIRYRLGNATGIDRGALDEIAREAADVANFAMMIVDRCAQLPEVAE